MRKYMCLPDYSCSSNTGFVVSFSFSSFRLPFLGPHDSWLPYTVLEVVAGSVSGRAPCSLEERILEQEFK